jgi:hypothetical protein
MGISIGGGGSGVPMVGAGTGHRGGTVPDPGGTAGLGRVLWDDGTFRVPPSASNAQRGGPLWFDISKAPYNLVPTLPGSTKPDHWHIIQQAIDDAYAAMVFYNATRATVFLPSGYPYWVYRPLLLEHIGVELIGENWGTILNAVFDGPAVVMGLMRTMKFGASTHTLDLTYRPDAGTVLDSSAVSSTFFRNGFRTNTNAFLGFQETPFDAGRPTGEGGRLNRWAGEDRLLIEFCLTPGDLTQTLIPTTAGYFCGCGGLNAENPISMGIAADTNGNPTMQVRFRTATFTDWPGSNSYTFTFRLCGTNGGAAAILPPWRGAVWLDLRTNTYAAWLNKIQVQLTGVSLPPTAGNTFKINYMDAFCIFGTSSGQLPFPGGPGRLPDWSIFGFHMNVTQRYAINGVGTPQVKLTDGTTPNDSYAYFTPDAGTLGLFLMRDVVSGEAALSTYRFVSVDMSLFNAKPTAMGFFYSFEQGEGHSYSRIANLTINGPGSGGTQYGYGIAIAAVLDLEFEHLHVTSNGYALGCLNFGATYTIRGLDCHLDGGDSGLYYFDCVITTTGFEYPRSGNFTVKGCGSNVYHRDDNFYDLDGTTYCLYFFYFGTYDSQLYIDNAIVDSESGGVARSMIACFGAPFSGTQLTVDRITTSFLSPGCVLELVDGGSPNSTWLPNTVSMRGVTTISGDTIVRLNGGLWRGDIEVRNSTLDPQIVQLSSPVANSPTNVRLTHREFTRYFNQVYSGTVIGHPTENAWIANAHRIIVTAPAPGQPTEWRVSRSGVIGSATTALFAPVAPIPASPGVMAAYSSVHTDYAIAKWQDQEQGLTAIGLAGSLWLGLSKMDAAKSGALLMADGVTSSEPSGGGYARVQIPRTTGNWNPASLSETVNAVAFTFPLPTTDWGIARSAFLADASTGGNVLRPFNLVTPVDVRAGTPAPNFPAGNLWIARI